jgi:hypothetical protein
MKMTNDTVVTYTVTIAPEAIEEHRRCMSLIADAYAWASDYRVATDMANDNTASMVEEYNKRQALAREMERSFLTNWSHLTTSAQEYDGPIRIMRDMWCGFFWKHEKSGYHGGLLFHRNYAVQNNDRIGTWSIHT